MHPEPRLASGPLDIYMPPRATGNAWQAREEQGSRVFTRYLLGALRVEVRIIGVVGGA